MSEETKGADKSTGVAIWLAVLVSSLSGLLYILALTFSIQGVKFSDVFKPISVLDLNPFFRIPYTLLTLTMKLEDMQEHRFIMMYLRHGTDQVQVELSSFVSQWEQPGFLAYLASLQLQEL